MSRLADFRGALLDASQPVPIGLSDGQGRPAGRRYSVYRNNIAVSLTDSLASGFPVVQKLIGAENFRNIAGVFLRQHPPSTPLMMHYGAGFPEFLEGFPPLAHLGYLGDVARLELAMRRSYHAADAAPADATILQNLEETALMACRMRLAPATQILRSNWPVVSIWAFNMIQDAPKPEARAEDTLVTRPEFDPQPHVLPAGGAAFLEALAKDKPFGESLSVAQTTFADFDLGATLNLALSQGVITQILT